MLTTPTSASGNGNGNGPARPRTSQLLRAAIGAADTEMVTIGELVAVLRRRAYGFVLLIVALVNCVPLPPFVSSLAGIPVFLVGIQMVMGRPRPWLPRWVRQREFRRGALRKRLDQIEPYIQRVERFARPRYPKTAQFFSRRIIGAVVVLLSLYIMVPMVFTNIPPAMAAVFISIAMIEEDGLLLPVGVVGAFAAMALSTLLAGGALFVIVGAAARMWGY